MAIPDQKAKTIGRHFDECVVCICGQTGMQTFCQTEVCRLFEVQKINTSGYNPQTSGLCERFDSTLV